MLRWYYIVVAAIRSLVARRSDDQVQSDLRHWPAHRLDPYGLGPMDPATIVLASSTLILVSLAAGYLPAFRASRLDPVAVLRE